VFPPTIYESVHLHTVAARAVGFVIGFRIGRRCLLGCIHAEQQYRCGDGDEEEAFEHWIEFCGF
jgi:hypothetical protein